LKTLYLIVIANTIAVAHLQIIVKIKFAVTLSQIKSSIEMKNRCH